MTHDYAVMTFWADGYRAIDPESYFFFKLISSVLLYKITVGIHLFSFRTLQPESGGGSFLFFFDVFTFDMVSTNLPFTVYMRITDRMPALSVWCYSGG